MTEPLQQDALALRISVTDRCQLRCVYCAPESGPSAAKRQDILSFEEIVRFARVIHAGPGVSSVRITGGEPLLRAGVADLIREIASAGIRDLALTTNGQRLAAMAGELKEAGLRRVNISLDALDEDAYAAVCRRSGLRETLDGIEAALAAGLRPVKINCVALRGRNDDQILPLTRYALDCGCHIRFLEFMPIGHAAPMFDQVFMPASEVKAHLSEEFGLWPLGRRAGATSRDYAASDGKGRSGVVGFVSPETDSFCSECRRLRLTSTGDLIACLAKGTGPNVRSLLRDDRPDAAEELLALVGRALCSKRPRTGFETRRGMAAVGG